MADVVIAVDPDSNRLTATITADDDFLCVRQKVLPHDRGIERVCYVAMKWIRELCREYGRLGDDVHFFIEKPFVSPKFLNAVIPLSRINGAAMAGAYDGGAVTVQDVQIQSWKKETVGKGNASKPEIKAWVKVCWPVAYEAGLAKPKAGQQDCFDSSGINHYARKIVRRAKKVKKFYATQER